jgi:succinate-semialdehyde dehydrogenase/glutarate-semialdehyde dehydrogenase
MLIDGEWTGGTAYTSIAVENPATEDKLGDLPFASAADLDRALEASAKGFDTWKKTPALERQAVMERAAQLMETRREAIARTCTLELGKPLRESLQEMDFVIGVLRWYAEEAKRAYGRIIPARAPNTRNMVMKEPVGPVLAFVAWNFPGTNFIRKVAGALGAGCSIIVKPSEETPGTAIAIARCFQEAGLPAGVLNVVFGDACHGVEPSAAFEDPEEGHLHRQRAGRYPVAKAGRGHAQALYHGAWRARAVHRLR